MDGKFKSMDKFKKEDEQQRPKFNLICIGKVKDNKSRIVLSEKTQVLQKWSRTTLKNAPIELQIKVNAIVCNKKNTNE